MVKFLALIGFLAIVSAIVVLGYVFGGFFNVAASVKDPDMVNRTLGWIRQASIARHAEAPPPMSLDDLATVRVGARAYSQRGCVQCHGAPGVEWSKFSEGLNPDPPDLKEIVSERQPGELFWVVRNGIKMTGMPSFAAVGASDQEIWSIVAFLKKLPTTSADDYKAWSAPAVDAPSPPP